MTIQTITIRIVFIAAALVVFFLSIFSYTKINSLVESAAILNHSTEVKLELEKVLGCLTDAETSSRGYILTHDKTFLEPFDKSVKAYPQILKTIKQLTTGDASQQIRLVTVEKLAKKREVYLRKMIGLAKTQTPTTSQLLIGKAIMDKLREEVSTMIAHENGFKKGQTRELEILTMAAPLTLLIFSLTALVILILSYGFLNRALLEAQRLKNENLKFIVDTEKQKEIQHIFKQAPVAISIFRGPEFIVESINETGLQMWGKKYEDVIDKPYFETSPELRPAADPVYKNILETGQGIITNEEKVEFIRNGKPYVGYFNFMRQPLRNIQGVIDGVITVAIEVTESVYARKEVEESEERYRDLTITLEQKVEERTKEIEQNNIRLKELNRELKVQKEFSETILNTTPELIGAYDSEMRIIAFNKACEDLFQIKKEDVLGKKYVEAFPGGKNSQGHLDLIRAMNGEIIHNPVYHSATLGRYYENFIIPLTDELGKVYAAVAIAHDSTEVILASEKIKKTNAELEEKNTELIRANKELESFTYISSHDLQEPLRQIQNFASRLRDMETQNFSEKGKTYLDKMSNAANRMQTLIADLLAYSRTKTAERKFEITNLNHIVEDVIVEIEEQIEEKHATFEVAPLLDANVIPFQFRQMVHNLVGNALKFTKPETPPHIIIKSRIINSGELPELNMVSESAYYHFSIADNGIGIEPQYKDKIFEVFQRLHVNQKIGGTGIGLAIVKKIVENHNGIIIVTGLPNQGCTFDIYFPAT